MKGPNRDIRTVIALVAAAAAGAVGVALASAGGGGNGTAGELRYVETTFGASGAANQYRATCPKRRHVTGGGYDLPSGEDLAVRDAGPFDGGDRGRLRDDGFGVEADGTADALTVTAICDR